MSGAWAALARFLQRDGSVVATASNGRHARTALLTPRYTMILGDLRMPERDGCAFYARLWQQGLALSQQGIVLPGKSSAADSQVFLGVTDHGAFPEAPSSSERSINNAEILRKLEGTGGGASIARSAW